MRGKTKSADLKLVNFCEYRQSKTQHNKKLENQFIYPVPRGSKMIFFAPHGVGVNEENQ
jgi:uncharacterized radical SAM superfamily Fe-S cluster-containing enzyme